MAVADAMGGTAPLWTARAPTSQAGKTVDEVRGSIAVELVAFERHVKQPQPFRVGCSLGLAVRSLVMEPREHGLTALAVGFGSLARVLFALQGVVSALCGPTLTFLRHAATFSSKTRRTRAPPSWNPATRSLEMASLSPLSPSMLLRCRLSAWLREPR